MKFAKSNLYKPLRFLAVVTLFLLFQNCSQDGFRATVTAENAATSNPINSDASNGNSTTPLSPATPVTMPTPIPSSPQIPSVDPAPQAPTPANAVWVATNGDDINGIGSIDQPFKTIARGLTALTSGGTLVIKSGVYVGPQNFINQKMHPFNSGTAGKETTIRAEIPFGVRIETSGSLNYYDNALYVTGSYINVDGIIYVQNNSTYPPFVGQVDGSFVKITRSIFKRMGALDPYGGFFYLGGNNCLVEDVAGVGHARYGFNAGGPDSTQSQNIFRRIVARVDYVSSSQPKAAFSIYGNNDLPIRVKNFLVQNLIVIDGQNGPTLGDKMYGGVYQPKYTENIKFYGSIILNNQADYAGYFLAEYPNSNNIHLVNSVSWGNGGSNSLAGVRANNNGGGTLWERLTIGKNPVAYYADIIGANNVFSNSYLLSNNSVSSTGSTGFSNYSNVQTTSSPPLKYIVDSENSTQGAQILFRYGKSGTLWGESGYDIETTEKIWPWPYEDQIKAVFAESNPVPPGAVPSTNNTKRGFAADGNDAFGQPLTLTRYIWQFLGSQIPPGIY